MATAEGAMPAARARAGGPWWIFLGTGILWLIYSLAILSLDTATVLAVAVLFGIALIFAGVAEFVAAAIVEGWKWLHVLLGILFIGAGIWALAWPGRTFLVLASITAWVLLFLGLFNLILAFATAGTEFWWLRLILGFGQIIIAFWALGSPTREIAILVVWVAAWTLARGITDLILAFELKRMQEGAG